MKINFLLAAVVILMTVSQDIRAAFGPGNDLLNPYNDQLTVQQDTVPLRDRNTDFINSGPGNPFDLNDPASINRNVEYDAVTNTYKITETIGDDYYRAPTYMTFDEYMAYRDEQQRQTFFRQQNGGSTGTSSGLKDPMGNVDVKNDLIDRLFGGSEVTIKPQGSIDLTIGGDYSRTENPNLTLRQQRQGGFDFDMAIQMNVTGSIGEKLNLSTNYNTQATFGFENQMKLDYDTDNFSEDEIIKKIEAGDVSLPLKGTLIQGAQKLFGLKTGLQFGRLKLEILAAQQRSQQQSLQIQGGAQIQEYEVRADEYDENRHFFLSHYNRESFETALANLPQIKSLFRVKNIEIWVTNTRNETEDIVDIVALTDLGEPERLTSDVLTATFPPRNPDIIGKGLPGFIDKADSIISQDRFANDLLFQLKNYEGIRDIDNTVRVLTNEFNLQPGIDFKKVSARKLRPNEFTFNEELGTISLNVNLQPDDVLGVAYEYSYNGENFQVGEMAQDVYNPEELGVLFVKMLKSSITRVDKPIWDLMMKNVYSLGAFQVGQEDFLLDIYYEDPGAGFKRFLPETNLAGVPLLRVFNLDRLNVQGDPCADGIFDFVPGITINPRNGRVMFPVLEPFGEDLVQDMDPEFREKFEYFHLYDSTITRAREYPDLNRFAIRGSYKSSVASEISLGAFNIPPGSVRVTAGGVQLSEEAGDYEVDYNIGKVRILNDAYLNSGTPINVSFEDNTLFGIQNKSMIGVRADYEFSKNLTLGGTYLHLFERPFTQKVNIGDDPISNRMFGLDINYSDEAPWLTKIVDAIPFIDTKEKSTVTFAAEAAYLKPGHAKAININQEDSDDNDKGGTVYLDDFEGSTTGFDLRNPTNNWVLASVPQNDVNNNNPLFPESAFIDSTISGVNRAKLAWYRADEFVRSAADQNDPYASGVEQSEIFPNRDIQVGQNSRIPVLDLTYFPGERGPYNFDLPGDGYQGISSGLSDNGNLLDPTSRWAGIMRALPNNDFESANIEYIDFWLLNPFIDTDDTQGDLYFNLGNISEDILRDSRRSFENGIPGDADAAEQSRTDTTSWGRVPRVQAFTDAFDLDPDNRIRQDVGLDGLNDQEEMEIFSEVLQQYQANLDPAAYNRIEEDPANDNFVFFNDMDVFGENDGVFDRYKDNNDPQGNSAVSTDNNVNSATNLPDTEDLNDDNSLNEDEQYFQYHVPLRPFPIEGGRTGLDTNHPWISDFIDQNTSSSRQRRWYRFKIPIEDYTSAVGGIQDFRSIQFIRMYLKNFNTQTTLRFATLELTRNQWRRYQRKLETVTSGIASPTGDFSFILNDVNIEENGDKEPFNYVLPPGIAQENAFQTQFPDQLQNEQSLSMVVENLPVDSAVGIYKILNLDMRVYEELEMFIHAEQFLDQTGLDDGDLSVFIRLGSDFQNNFYEYEIPLTVSRDDTSFISNSDAYRAEVWRPENDMNINLKELIEIKKRRNENSDFGLGDFYIEADANDPTRTYRLKGNPNLGLVKGIMIGLVNRDLDGIKTHSAEVWVNELRLNGLDERGGVAALARLDLQLADFGTAQAAVSYGSIGYGSIEQKLADRSREEVLQVDLATNLELGRFFGEKSGIKIPFYWGLSQTLRTPQFDPYDLDIPLKEKLAEAQGKVARDSIKEQAQDYTNIHSVNVTNMRKTRTGNSDRKPKPWDIENFSTTLAYVETERHNPIIESDNIKTYRGVIDYNYQMKPLYIEPFKKLIKKDKYLKLLSEANLNLIPNSFSFSTNMDREFQETKYRFTELSDEFSTFYNKRFTWDRDYNLSWDITKALKFNFSANNHAIIDELKQFDDNTPRDEEQLNSFLWDNIKNFGRTKDYSHNIGANYTLPFKKIPFLDFINVKASYTASYSWAGSAIGTFSGPNNERTDGIAETLGNVIQNSQTRQLNGDLNFETLYKKSKYLAKINRGKSKSRSRSGNSRGSRDDSSNADDDSRSNDRSRGGSKRSRGDQKSDGGEDKLTSVGKDGKSSNTGGGRKGNKNNRGDKKGKDNKGNKNKEDDKKVAKKKTNREPTSVERILVRPFLSLRKARFTYSEKRGTVIPGWMPITQYIGTSDKFNAPGLDFVAGFQPDIAPNSNGDDWLSQAARSDYISTSIWQNQRASQSSSENYNARVTLEPFDDFKIDLEVNRRLDENSLLLFKNFNSDPAIRDFGHKDFQKVGSFQISYFALNTLFGSDSGVLFKTFEENRKVISNILGTGVHDNPEEFEYSEGNGRVQENVLVPAFLRAYTGQSAESFTASTDFTKSLFDKNESLFHKSNLPKINWNVTYNGLSKLDMFKDIFQSVKLNHGYQSTLTVNSFNNDQAFNEEVEKVAKDDNFNFFSRFQIPNIVIDERFNPLLGVSVRTKSGMDINVDFKKARNLSMSFVNYVLSEQLTQEYVVGFGYTMENVYIPLFYGKKGKREKTRTKKNDSRNGQKDKGGADPDPDGKGKPGAAKGSDLNFRFDFSLRDDKTENFTLDQDFSEITRGVRTLTFSPSVDYDVNEKLNVRLFFDYRSTVPATSQGFPTLNTSGGVIVRFTLD